MKCVLWTRAALIALAFFATGAHADEQAIRKVFKAKLPDAKVLSMQKLPWFLANGEKYQGALPMNTLIPMLDAAAPPRKR